MYEYKFSPNEKEYFPDIDKFHGHEFLYQSLLDSTENDREFMFTLLVGHKNSFRIIKLTFLWNLLLGRKFDVPEHKIFQLQDRFFLFEVNIILLSFALTIYEFRVFWISHWMRN